MNISEHITLAEATKSQAAIRAGIDNTPDEETVKRMKYVADNCFEPMRTWYEKPLFISSFFRCKKLNEKIGGSTTSQHCKGEAIDIDTGSREENKKLFDWAKVNLMFDQLIYEYGDETGPEWVHISLRKELNRKQVLTIKS